MKEKPILFECGWRLASGVEITGMAGLFHALNSFGKNPAKAFCTAALSVYVYYIHRENHGI